MDTAGASPTDDALARLGKLAAAGVPAERITEEVGALIAGWAGEADMDAPTAQARIERLWDSLSTDAADLDAALSDADGADAAALSSAKRVRSALRAAVSALAEAHRRL